MPCAVAFQAVHGSEFGGREVQFEGEEHEGREEPIDDLPDVIDLWSMFSLIGYDIISDQGKARQGKARQGKEWKGKEEKSQGYKRRMKGPTNPFPTSFSLYSKYRPNPFMSSRDLSVCARMKMKVGSRTASASA